MARSPCRRPEYRTAIWFAFVHLSPGATGMPMARVLDTVVGALVGIAFALVFSTLDDRAQLAAHHEQARAG